jgi:hypothetical protein
MNLVGMPRPMLIRIRFPRLFPVLFLLCFVHLPASNAQNVEPLKFFRDYVGLKEDQIAAIRNGKGLAKVVESRTPDEVFVFGSLYVQSTPEKYLKGGIVGIYLSLPLVAALRVIYRRFASPPVGATVPGSIVDSPESRRETSVMA